MMSGAKISTCFFYVILTAFYATPTASSMSINGDEDKEKKQITLHSDEFFSFTKQKYYQLQFTNSDTLDYEVYKKALQGFIYLKQTEELSNDSLLTIIDFSKHCNTKRLWVLNLKTNSVVFNELVSHGKNSGDEYAKYFSNSHRSHKSSLGFYVTGGTYYGRNDLSLKLNGLEPGFNTNAFTRGIVIHGANYVGNIIAERQERIGRSYGCPAVPQRINKQLVNTLKGGSCLFIYHPTSSYLENSKILNANLYLSVDELSI